VSPIYRNWKVSNYLPEVFMTPIMTSIINVTVYPDQARITRSGSLHVTPSTSGPGSQWLEIDGLPLELNPDSLRASARGTARARLLGMQSEHTFYTETPAELTRKLEEQVEALQDEIHLLDAQAELVKQNRVNLDKLASHTETYAIALAAGEMSVEGQLGMFEGLRRRAGELDTELQTMMIEKRAKERQLQKTRNELDQQRSALPRQRYTASVEVDVLMEGDLTIELSYAVSSAGWKPLYDIRFLEDKEGKPNLEIGYLAQVSQRTAENWENVSMSLSTARPALAGRIPELDPWYIGPVRSFMAAKRVIPSAPAPMTLRTADADLAGGGYGAPLQEFEAEVSLARVDTSGAAITYFVPNVVNIPSDGAPHKVAVTHYALSPKLDYALAPKLVQAAYRRATVVNDSPYTLLPGVANLFNGDEFIGTTQLELVAPQGEIELYLGVDDRIKVERELKRRSVDKRLIGGKRRILYAYEIELENLLPGEAQVILHDQIPVSRHEEIKVKLESADPSPTEHTELNLLDWELTMQPKEKLTLRFDFSVEYPHEMEVSGLP
jgi:uncharacterized protein (TIGR02231 family)